MLVVEPFVRPGNPVVFSACPCGGTQLYWNDDTLVAECEHMVLCLEGDKIIEYHSLGVRH